MILSLNMFNKTPLITYIEYFLNTEEDINYAIINQCLKALSIRPLNYIDYYITSLDLSRPRDYRRALDKMELEINGILEYIKRLFNQKGKKNKKVSFFIGKGLQLRFPDTLDTKRDMFVRILKSLKYRDFDYSRSDLKLRHGCY